MARQEKKISPFSVQQVTQLTVNMTLEEQGSAGLSARHTLADPRGENNIPRKASLGLAPSLLTYLPNLGSVNLSPLAQGTSSESPMEPEVFQAVIVQSEVPSDRREAQGSFLLSIMNQSTRLSITDQPARLNVANQLATLSIIEQPARLRIMDRPGIIAESSVGVASAYPGEQFPTRPNPINAKVSLSVGLESATGAEGVTIYANRLSKKGMEGLMRVVRLNGPSHYEIAQRSRWEQFIRT